MRKVRCKYKQSEVVELHKYLESFYREICANPEYFSDWYDEDVKDVLKHIQKFLIDNQY